MATRSANGHSHTVGAIAEWSVAVASLALVLAVVLATIRIAPAQDAGAPTLQRPSPDQATPSPTLPSTGEDATRKLERGNGVIAPPRGVDEEMAVRPNEPASGSRMPVIRPAPGTDVSPRQ